MKSYQKSNSLTAGMLDPFRFLSVDEWGPSVSLELVKPIQSVKVDALLALLNRKVPKPVQVPGSMQPLASTGVEPIKFETIRSTHEVLKLWIDEWLDTGRSEYGEDPRTRSIQTAENVMLAVYEFCKRGRAILMPEGNSLGLWLVKYDPEPKSTLRPAFGPRPEDYAREHLVFFLLSELRFTLAKCRGEHCDTYFLLKHKNRLYKRGTFCDSCQRHRSQRSARQATVREREDVKLTLHRGVARRFGKDIRRNPLWHRDEGLKEKISLFLNTRFGEKELVRAAYPKGITGKWVANKKNWDPIERAAKGGK